MAEVPAHYLKAEETYSPELEAKLPEYYASIPPGPPSTVSVLLNCHGGPIPLGMDQIIENIDGVTISKYTYAGFCQNANAMEIFDDIQFCKHTALKLLHEFDKVTYSKEEYFDFLRSIGRPELCADDSCSKFTNPSGGWMNKMYSTTGKDHESLILAYVDKTIDLLNCTEEELYDFIGYTAKTKEDKDFIMKTISDIFPYTKPSGNKYISLEYIFTIILMFNLFQRVDTVRILDLSCNANLTEKPPPNVGYGGKRTKRPKSKRRKSRKK